jgi:hypothetical protein
MVKYLSFLHNSSFALRYFLNVNGKATVGNTPLVIIMVFLCPLYKAEMVGTIWGLPDLTWVGAKTYYLYYMTIPQIHIKTIPVMECVPCTGQWYTGIWFSYNLRKSKNLWFQFFRISVIWLTTSGNQRTSGSGF